MSIKEQIESAQRQIATWPKWMQDAAVSTTRKRYWHCGVPCYWHEQWRRWCCPKCGTDPRS